LITSHVPEDWRALQADVGRILGECGFEVEVEKRIHLARGHAEIDVYATETVGGRLNMVLCECKRWKENVPQQVVHSFRTIVADAGANIGYLISSSGFQPGAGEAADLTNIRLLTWEQFQAEFEPSWIELYLLPQVADRLDPLFRYSTPEPWMVEDLSSEGRRYLDKVVKESEDLTWLMSLFTPEPQWGRGRPELPIRNSLGASSFDSHLPDELLDAVGYREFLEAAFKCAKPFLDWVQVIFTTMTGPDL
jgi:restriction endonuclease